MAGIALSGGNGADREIPRYHEQRYLFLKRYPGGYLSPVTKCTHIT